MTQRTSIAPPTARRYGPKARAKARRTRIRRKNDAYRQRSKLGRAVFRVELDLVAVEEMLLQGEFLAPAQRDDRRAVELALTRLIEKLIVASLPAARPEVEL